MKTTCRQTWAIAAAMVCVSPALATENPVVWNNVLEPSVWAGAIVSQGWQTAINAQVADDFLFPPGVVITDVRWTGVYAQNPPVPDPGPEFIIRFYPDNGTGQAPTGGPGDPSPTALATYFTGIGGGHQTPNGGPLDGLGYSYELPTAFVASPNVKYWISVQAILELPPRWYWSFTWPKHHSQAVRGSTGQFNWPFWSVPFPGGGPSQEYDMIFSFQGTILPDCPADVNGDGVVNVDDLLEVINAWGPCPPPCPQDITGNATVDVGDLLVVISTWGSCP